MNSKSFLLIVFYFFFYFTVFAEDSAEIRAIDRITGRSFNLKVPLDTEVTFSNLVLNIKYCYKNPIDTWESNVNGTLNLLESTKNLRKHCHEL